MTTGAGSTLTVVAVLSTGAGTLSGTATEAAVAGVANFAGNGLSIDLMSTSPSTITLTVDLASAPRASLDRLVASLSGRPPGLRYEMQFIIGSPYAEGTSLPIGGTLETSRASVFVRDMLSRGAPPDSLSVGLKPGNPDEITLWFLVRLKDEERHRWTAGGGT